MHSDFSLNSDVAVFVGAKKIERGCPVPIPGKVFYSLLQEV